MEKKEKEWLMVSGCGEREAKEMQCHVHKWEVESIKGKNNKSGGHRSSSNFKRTEK